MIQPVEFRFGSQLAGHLREMINDYVKMMENYFQSHEYVGFAINESDKEHLIACKQLKILVNEQFPANNNVERDMTSVILFRPRSK